MNKILERLNKHKPLVIAIILLILLAPIMFYLRNVNQTKPQTTSSSVFYRDKVQPGIDNKDSVIKSLGEPVKQSDWNNQQILSYSPSDNEKKWKDQIFLDSSGTVNLIIELVSQNNPNDKDYYLKKFGNPEMVLYGPGYPVLNMFVYASYGFAIVTETQGKHVSEVWYFEATDKAAFYGTIANMHGYVDIPPEILD